MRGSGVQVQIGVALVIALATLLVPMAQAGPVPAGTAGLEPVHRGEQGQLPAAERLLGLLDGANEIDVYAAFYAQQEAQGLLPEGFVANLLQAHAAAVAGIPPLPPENIYRDAHPFCDTNGDGYNEVLVNDYNLVTVRPTLRMLDGRTGKSLWLETNTLWYPVGAMPQSYRALDPHPLAQHEPKNVQTTIDLDRDGVCDFFTHTFTITGNGPAQGLIQGVIRAHSGASSFQNIWQYEYRGLIISAGDPIGLVQCLDVQGFPTGFLATVADDGARLAFKTTDLHRCDVTIPDPFGVIGDTRVSNVWAADHVFLFTGASNVPVWTHDFGINLSANRTEVRWLSGFAQINGGEPDLVLDQLWIANPRSNRGEVDDPRTGQPLTRNGRGMDVLALDGDSGRQVWLTPIWDDLAVRANPPAQEEGFEEMRGTYAYPIADITGDGFADVMAQVLAQEAVQATSVNGAFRTHFFPLDGATGERLWGSVRYQGWGHAQTLQGPTGVMVAVGTMDVPTEIPPQSRFPPKDLRLAALDPVDGSPRWTHRAQYPQDSMIGYDLALQQYRLGLAPFDVDGDGWPDVVTPSQYRQPVGDQQVLLSQTTQRYEILSGANGKLLRHFDTFGSNGLVVPCGQSLVAVGGNGGHMHANRIDPRTARMTFSEVLFIDPTPTSAVAGIDLTFLSARCAATADNRTFVAANVGAYSQKRGVEILNLYGYPHSEQVDADGQNPVWMVPNHLAKSKLLDKLAALLEEPAPPTAGDRAVWAALPSVPGLLLGAVAGVVANRRAPLPPRPAKVKLPDLYGAD